MGCHALPAFTARRFRGFPTSVLGPSDPPRAEGAPVGRSSADYHRHWLFAALSMLNRVGRLTADAGIYEIAIVLAVTMRITAAALIAALITASVMWHVPCRS